MSRLLRLVLGFIIPHRGYSDSPMAYTLHKVWGIATYSPHVALARIDQIDADDHFAEKIFQEDIITFHPALGRSTENAPPQQSWEFEVGNHQRWL